MFFQGEAATARSAAIGVAAALAVASKSSIWRLQIMKRSSSESESPTNEPLRASKNVGDFQSTRWAVESNYIDLMCAYGAPGGAKASEIISESPRCDERRVFENSAALAGCRRFSLEDRTSG